MYIGAIMKRGKIIKLVTLSIIWIVVLIGLGLFINAKFFHKEAVAGAESHFEPMVYITPYGECYHTSDCSYIKRKSSIGLYQAQERGYRSCLHCEGEAEGEIWINGTPDIPTQNNYLASFVTSFVITIPVGLIILSKIVESED